MIDLPTVAALAGIAAVGGVVIFVATRPSRDWDAEGHYPGYDRGPPPPPTPESERHPKRTFSGTVKPGEPTTWAEVNSEDEADVEVFVSDEDCLRFFIGTKPWRDGRWRIRDRALFREVPGKSYMHRSSALRAARRLNAKEATKRPLPAYDPKWAVKLNPRFQIMGWPEPFSPETLVLDTDLARVISRHPTAKAALFAADLLNNPVGGAA